jgi:hypothetical protein
VPGLKGTGETSPTVISATGRVSAEERAPTMWFQFITMKHGKRRLNWQFLAIFVASTYFLVVSAAEVFWLGFTGGFSLLIGGYAFVLATLIVIRVVGSGLIIPADLSRARAGGV